MKRFIGLVLALAGGAATLWGGFYCLTGNASHVISVTQGFSVTALTAALAGVAVLTLGLIWARD